MAPRFTKGSPGTYFATINGFYVRIVRVPPEARQAGYSDGWTLFINEEAQNVFDTKWYAVEVAQELIDTMTQEESPK